MGVIPLDAADLACAAVLVLLLAFVSYRLQLGLGRRMILSGIRMTIQLLLIGLVLRSLFSSFNFWLIIAVSLIMLLVAGREIRLRQKRKLSGFYGYGVGVISMFISSFSITIFSLIVIIEVKPWYSPQYAIPLLGMLLGNTMTGITLATDRITSEIYEQRSVIEQRLYLGETWQMAVEDILKDCMRTGMVPIINSMAAAGIVSLPGMMTGQILGGSPPIEAVKYQILIMFLITAGTGFGVVCSIWLTSRHLFDERHRLRLDKLKIEQSW